MFQLILLQEKTAPYKPFKGLSTTCSFCQTKKGMDYGSIRRRSNRAAFRVPCSRLEIHSFDKHPNANIHES